MYGSWSSGVLEVYPETASWLLTHWPVGDMCVLVWGMPPYSTVWRGACEAT